MPITNTHPEYDKHINLVVKTRDALEGDVREYVPRKESQTPQQYDVFRNRPSYYNVVERTVNALVGALTRKPMTVEGVVGDVPKISGGDTLDEFVQQAYVELLVGGRLGILVDYDDDDMMPYLVMYHSENIVNWCKEYVILREQYYKPMEDDHYKVGLHTKYRELYIDEEGFYAVRIWKETKKDMWEVHEEYQPMVRGQRLTEIPFTFVNSHDTNPGMAKPVLSTLANINIEHFILQAQMAHVTWVMSFPLPTIIGDLANDAQQVGFGSDKFLHLTQGSDAKFLEFTGSGVKVIGDQIMMKEQQMFSLGSRLLQYKAGVESSDALQIRLGSEGASLITLANSLEAGLTYALTWYNMWFNVNAEPPVVSLNKDFSPSVIDPQQMTALLSMYSAGVITLDTLLHRLYEGEVVDNPITEKEQLNQPTVAPAASM